MPHPSPENMTSRLFAEKLTSRGIACPTERTGTDAEKSAATRHSSELGGEELAVASRDPSGEIERTVCELDGVLGD